MLVGRNHNGSKVGGSSPSCISMKDKDLNALIKRAEKQGWRVVKNNNSHLAWYPPDGGEFVITGSTPSEPRSFNNAKACLRRHGLVL